MEKRHRAVAAVAAGAVAVALGAGAARSCAGTSEPTAGSDPRDAGGSTAWVEVVPGTGSSGDAEEGGADAAAEEATSCAAELESLEWMGAEDASLRMTASGGRLVHVLLRCHIRRRW